MKRTPVIIVLAGMAALAVTGTALATARNDEPTRLTGLGSAVATTDPSGSPTPDDSTFPTADPTPSSAATSTAPPAGGNLSTDDAARIAVDRVGGGTVTEIESEREHGVSTWKVEVVRDGIEHDIYVDRTNGGIVKADQDDDRDHDDRDDDDHDDRDDD
jgi:hypothetical protein